MKMKNLRTLFQEALQEKFPDTLSYIRMRVLRVLLIQETPVTSSSLLYQNILTQHHHESARPFQVQKETSIYIFPCDHHSL